MSIYILPKRSLHASFPSYDEPYVWRGPAQQNYGCGGQIVTLFLSTRCPAAVSIYADSRDFIKSMCAVLKYHTSADRKSSAVGQLLSKYSSVLGVVLSLQR